MAASAGARAPFPRFHWAPYGVAQGEACLAVLRGYFDSCEPFVGWDRVAHAEVAVGISAIENLGPVQMDPFAGLAGLGNSLLAPSPCGLRYRKLTRQIDAELADATAAIADRCFRKTACSSGVFASKANQLDSLRLARSREATYE